MNNCLNCIYLVSGYQEGFGLCGYEPKVPACGRAGDKERIHLDAPFSDCECWAQDPTKTKGLIEAQGPVNPVN